MIKITNKRTIFEHFLETWHYRDLLYFLAWRHILVRYKQTVFGVLWSVFRPVLATIILVLVFHRFIGLQSGGIPYPLVVISGLLLWHLFANAVSSGSTSLVAEQTLVTRAYVPRMILPLSAMVVNVIEAFITLGLILVMKWHYDLAFSTRMLMVLPAMALTFLLAFGVALIFTALHARYRDVTYIIPFFLQMGFYLSPVAFLTSHVPPQWQVFYYFDPLVGLIELFRWSLFDSVAAFPATSMAVSLGVTGVILATAFAYFFHVERTVADVI